MVSILMQLLFLEFIISTWENRQNNEKGYDNVTNYLILIMCYAQLHGNTL